jgi:hypothetical protein
MSIGIYYLSICGHLYIGKSLDIDRRIKEHIRNLAKGSHYNTKMQDKYYDHKTIEYGVIEYCDPDILDSREMYWIAELDTVVNGLNISTNEGTSSPNTKFNREEIIKCVELLCNPLNSIESIVESTGMSKGTVQHINNLDHHTWLRQELPGKCSILENIRVNNLRVRNDFKPIILISPEGIEFTVSKMRQFAAEHKLLQSTLSLLVNRKRDVYKGWRLKL